MFWISCVLMKIVRKYNRMWDLERSWNKSLVILNFSIIKEEPLLLFSYFAFLLKIFLPKKLYLRNNLNSHFLLIMYKLPIFVLCEHWITIIKKKIKSLQFWSENMETWHFLISLCSLTYLGKYLFFPLDYLIACRFLFLLSKTARVSRTLV